MRSDDDFAIVLDRNELMCSDRSASEEALATMTCERLGGRPAPQLLIGGYGKGFTLRAALAALGEDASVTVAELVPEIIQWARGPMRELTAECLDDARVLLVMDDVAMLIDAAWEGYDAILLDVDNGPEGLTRRLNDRLYSRHGRSEEHTSELQSLMHISYAVFCLKKKKILKNPTIIKLYKYHTLLHYTIYLYSVIHSDLCLIH